MQETRLRILPYMTSIRRGLLVPPLRHQVKIIEDKADIGLSIQPSSKTTEAVARPSFSHLILSL